MTDTRTTSKGIDVLNTSVAELMIIGIFFILLAFTITQANLVESKAKETDILQQFQEQTKLVSILRTRIESLKKMVGVSAIKLAETLFKRKVRIDELEKLNSDLSKSLDISSKSLAEAKLQIKAIQRSLEAVGIERDELKAEMKKISAEVGTLDDLNKSIITIKRIASANDIDPEAPLESVLSSLEELIGKLTTSKTALKRSLEDLLKKYGVKESDENAREGETITARCWKPEEKIPDTVFNISIGSNGFKVTPAWPKVRDADANSSVLIRAMVKEEFVSLNNFKKLGKKIREESEKRKPPCVFVAKVLINQTDMPNAAQFKRLHNVARRYFYTK